MLSLRARIAWRRAGASTRSGRRASHHALAISGMAMLVLPLTSLGVTGPSLTATPSTAVAGAHITVTGRHFASRTKVQLHWDGAPSGMPPLTTGRDGAFSATMVVPYGSAGTHVLTATVANASRSVQLGGSSTTTTPTFASDTVVVLDSTRNAGVSQQPTTEPTSEPTLRPEPTEPPTAAPTAAPEATAEPTIDPTPDDPTPDPTAKPTPRPTPDPTTPPTPKPTAPPSGGVPAMPQADLLRKDFSDGKLWPFRVVDYVNDHPSDPMAYACDYQTDSSVARVHNGYLELRAYPRGDGRWNCGFVSTGMDGRGNGASFSFKYGYMQFAVKMNVGHATWQAPVWLLNTVTGWHAAEIDVAEVIGGRLTYNLHGVGNIHVASHAPPSGLSSRWHVFGVAKDNDHITFVMDGKVVGRWKGSMPDPMALLADAKVGIPWDEVYPNGSTPDVTWVKLAWITVSSKIPSGL